MNSISLGKITSIVAISVLAIIAICISWSSYVRIDAGEIVVVQSFSGKLDFYSQPGWEICPFSKVTVYRKSFQCEYVGDSANVGSGIPIRFNDGGTGVVSATIRADLPLDVPALTLIHTKYGSQEAVEKQLVRTSVQKAVNLTGPLMSSTESYAAKRSDLISQIEDQSKFGIYQTTTSDSVVTDPLTNEQKHINLVQIVKDAHGVPVRVEDSVAKQYGVTLYNFTFEGKGVDYSDTVETQIKAQQSATMNVQIGAANVKKSEQDKLTAEAEGEANAATAKWAQETENAKVVAVQEGLAKAAEFTKQAAALNKDAVILAAEGEAQAKKLRTEANNNLDQRLQAYVDICKANADAMSQMKVNVVPSIVFGGGGTDSTAGGQSNSVANLMNMMNAHYASQLGVDMNFSQPAAAAK
jgi:hypothetical protein